MVRKIVLIFILLALVAGVYIIIIENHLPKVKNFEICNYQYYIDNFPSQENIGPVIDAKDAVNKAEQIWVRLYGDKIKKEKPYEVFLDEKNGIWLVRGSLRSGMMGGVAHLIVEKASGKVLAVWHEK